MSEHLKSKHESHEHESKHEVEKKDLPDIEKLNQEALEKATEQIEVAELKDVVEKKAKKSDEIQVEDQAKAEKLEFGSYAALKGETYSHALKRIQQRLSKPERTMSKVMHNKAVEKVSDGLGKTAARPSGVLGGGIAAFVGSLLLLYVTKKYGYEYNYFMFFIFLAVGFAIGVLLEFTLFAARKAKR